MKKIVSLPNTYRKRLSRANGKKSDTERWRSYFSAIFSSEGLKAFIVQKLLKRSRYDFLVAAAILIYGIVFSWFLIMKNYGFGMFAWDLGVFNQSFHTTIFNGKFFYYTCELYFNPAGTYFASKFSPILFLVIPFYAIAPSPETLLVFKSFTLALGAIPLYLLSKEMIGSEKAGFVMVIAYLLNPGLQSSNGFDFQQQIFIPITLFSSYYFMIKKKWKLYFLSVFLALMIEEHVAVILVIMSFFQFLTINRVKTFVQEIRNLHFLKPSRTSSMLLGTMAFSALWYFVSRLARSVYPVAPAFVEVYRAIGNYRILGFTTDILSLPAYILMNPQRAYAALAYDFHLKFLFLIFLFAPLAFFSFRSKMSLAVAVLLVPFFLSNYLPYYTLGAHYPLYLVPLVFLGAVEVLGSLTKEGKTVSIKITKDLSHLLGIIIAASLIIIIAVSPLSPMSQPFIKEGLLWYAQPYPNEGDIQTLHKMISMVPQDASILTQNNLFPHFSNRINAYVVPIKTMESKTAEAAAKDFMQQELDICDYILLDSVGIETEPWTSFLFNEVISNSSFKIYALGKSLDGFAVLFMKNYNGSTIFVPDGDYITFLGNSDFYISNAELVNEPTSSSGSVALSQKGADPNIFLSGSYFLLPPGTFEITFEVKVGEHKEGYLATLDVSGNNGTSILSKKDIYGFDTPAGIWTNYTLPLTTTEPLAAIEFRIFTSGAADIYVDKVILRKVGKTADVDFGSKTFSQTDLKLEASELTDDGFIVYRHGQANIVLWYGPYAAFPSGTYEAKFFIKASFPLASPNQKVLTLDVASNFGLSQLVTKDVYSSDLFDSENTSRWHSFSLIFTSVNTLTEIEFRGLDASHDTDIYLAFISVERIT
jgi:uncharacterized membrane protein